MARVVHRLERHARGHGPITDHRNRVADALFGDAAQIACHGKAERRRDRRRRVTSAKRVIRAFAAFRETRQAVFLTEGPNTITTTRQNLMRVALVRNVPDDLIFGRIEHRMKRDRQFHDAQSSAQMPACHRYRTDRLGTQFIGHVTQFSIRHTF